MSGNSHFSSNIEFDARIISDVSLAEFMHWISSVDASTAFKAINTVYIIEHDRVYPFGQSVPVVVKINGNDYPLRTMSCQDVGCIRCGIGPPWAPLRGQGRGGYRFPWKGPWTRIGPVPEGVTPDEWRTMSPRMVLTITCELQRPEHYVIVCTTMRGTQIAHVEIQQHQTIADLESMILAQLGHPSMLQLVRPDGTLLIDGAASIGATFLEPDR